MRPAFCHGRAAVLTELVMPVPFDCEAKLLAATRAGGRPGLAATPPPPAPPGRIHVTRYLAAAHSGEAPHDQVRPRPARPPGRRSRACCRATAATPTTSRSPATRHGVVLRSPHAAAQITSHRHAAAKALPGVLAVYTAADLKADGIGGLPCADPAEEPRRHRPRRPAAPGARRRRRPPCRRPGRLHRRRDRRPARDGAEASSSITTSCPAAPTSPPRMEPGQPQVWPDAPNNVVFDWEIGDKAKTEALFAAGAPRHQADGGEQPRSSSTRWRRARRSPNTTRRRAGRCTPTRRAAGCIKDLLGGGRVRASAPTSSASSPRTSAAASA